jgi:ribonuclease BN (tRNA processing enzyme)
MSQYSPYEYSIHCLSNGSEYTDTTLLLTVGRGTTFCQRYAITGLTSLAARLAADQKVPLHTIRACFVGDGTVSKGIASLLLSLSQVGAGEVTICGAGSLDQHVDKLANIILGHRRHFPLIRTCEVPHDEQWYTMYEDDYLRVHGKVVVAQQQHVVWIYTLLKSDPVVSFAVVNGSSANGAILQPLPEDVTPILECIIYPQMPSSVPCTYPESLAKRAFVARAPSGADSDDGILIRATRQAKRLAVVLPFAFFFRSSAMDETPSVENELSSYSKLCFLPDGTFSVDDTVRTERLARSGSYYVDTSPAVTDVKDLEALKVSWSGKHAEVVDENEIDLDDDEDENEELEEQQQFPSVPHLLVLGTGCATPSALRGSSGYALLTPSLSSGSNNDEAPSLAMTAIIDCGEGTLTNIYRYLPGSLGPMDHQLAQIRFIWISHAHLDHYGGLEDMVVAIHSARSRNISLREKDDANSSNKRQRTTLDDDFSMTPVVVAPSKVLQYLDASLAGCSATQNKKRWYRGVTHRDLETSPFAQDLRNHVHAPGIHLLRSIQVEHCAHAHALVLNLANCFQLCYSGDTRPSTSLIQTAGSNISLLLHEATFADDERGKNEALQKKHSTVMEALDVAKQMKAKASLLTHFSQRYPKSPPGCDSNDNAAFAVDGMWFPLTDEAVQKLPALSRFVQQALKSE